MRLALGAQSMFHVSHQGTNSFWLVLHAQGVKLATENIGWFEREGDKDRRSISSRNEEFELRWRALPQLTWHPA